MRVSIGDPGPPLELADLSGLEARLGSQLPDSYKSFLLRTNGGTPTPDHFAIQGAAGNPFADVQTLFGIGATADFDDLERTLAAMSGRVPMGLLPIGHSSTNDLVCLSLREADHGTVYFWDSWADAEPAPWSRSGFANVYLIVDDFNAFLDGLNTYEHFAHQFRV